MSDIKFTIDGKECTAKNGQTIVEAAKKNHIYIPVLCHFDGLKPAGTCRICTVKAGGRFMAACTTPVTEGMAVENDTPELQELRKQIIEMLFVEGNHMCPICEKGGNCELQALGYRYKMMVPRFPYLWPRRTVIANAPKLYVDRNRCVQCLRCVRDVKTSDGKHVFGVTMRGGQTIISMDKRLAALLTEDAALKAMHQCPVGCILKKEIEYTIPIGQREFDTKPIGSKIEG